MYERINGKLYKQVDEQEAKEKVEKLFSQTKSLIDGIKTCEKNILAFNNQKQKYIEDISKIMLENGIDKQLIEQVMPKEANILGF